MSDNSERNSGHDWLWLLWALVAGIAGLMVYARMRPETDIGKHMNGLCDSLWSAMRRHCPCCHGAGAEPEALPAEGEGAA